jgi:DNA-binding XRE family transcriptional regulator
MKKNLFISGPKLSECMETAKRKHKIYQKAIAKALGTTRATINSWGARDKKQLSYEKAEILAKMLKVNINDLIYEEEPIIPSAGSQDSTPPNARDVLINSLTKHIDEYRVVLKSSIDGPYRMILESEIEEMRKLRDREIEKADKIISLLERENAELREKEKLTSPRSKHTNP